MKKTCKGAYSIEIRIREGGGVRPPPLPYGYNDAVGSFASFLHAVSVKGDCTYSSKCSNHEQRMGPEVPPTLCFRSNVHDEKTREEKSKTSDRPPYGGSEICDLMHYQAEVPTSA